MPHSYGWKKSLPDFRDRKMSIIRDPSQPLPPSVDLRASCPPVYDQGDLGSCTANAISGALEYDQLRQALPSYIPSRLYIYYNERVIEDSIYYDSGAELRDGFKAIAKWGYPSEDLWKYDTTQFTTKPPLACYAAASPQCDVAYVSLTQDLDQLRGALANGLPFVFGFTVYSSFETQEVANTGKMPMPDPAESVLGGHAVGCVGYSDDTQTFICRNSWSAQWGDKGYFYMPYAYMLNANLAADFWIITHVIA